MITYIFIGIILIVGIIFVKGYKDLNNLQNEATALVAYIKLANKGKSSLFYKDKSDEEFYKEKFDRLQEACFLLIRFSEKIRNKRANYRFQIRENGSVFGVNVIVTVEQFMHVITDLIQKSIDSMPIIYQKTLKDYLNQPYSPENTKISIEIKEKMWPKESPLKEWSSKLRQNIIDSDYLYTIFK